MPIDAYFLALAAIGLVALAAWLTSLVVAKVSFVDVLWPLFFLLSAIVYLSSAGTVEARTLMVTALVAMWALRLAVHIGLRNWGEPEDSRYRTLRENHQPFALKSLYIVFGLQGLLAWIISLPLLVALTRSAEIGVLESVAFTLWIVGFLFEAVGDYQLARFKNNPHNTGKVLDSGLWRYTRHPNYFGDFCIWWAFFLFAVSVGGWWTVVSPLLMSYLLLRVSGVALLEKTITDRRPEYAAYLERTNAFFPAPVKDAA